MPAGRAPCLRRQPGDRAADQFVPGRGGLVGGPVCHRDRRQPAQQRGRPQPVLLGGDVQRDGPRLGRQRGRPVPAGPVGEVRPVAGASAAGARRAGLLEQVSERLDQQLQLTGEVDGVQQRVGDRGLVRVVIQDRRQQPEPVGGLPARQVRLGRSGRQRRRRVVGVGGLTRVRHRPIISCRGNRGSLPRGVSADCR